MLAVILLATVALSACTSASSGTAAMDGRPEGTPPLGSRSTIVSAMENNYEESAVLDFDPCYDSFIKSMASIGYSLVADVVLPDGGSAFGGWSASCNYRSDGFGALVNSTTNPIMAPEQTLAPTEHIYGWSRLIDIGGRKTIVMPPAEGYDTCVISMTAAAGSVTIFGGPLLANPSMDPCAGAEDLARQIEPWIDD